MEEISVKLSVNGNPVLYAGDPKRTLLDFLREDLGLMGSKNGCGTGHCGACTVIIDGKAKRSCLIRMAKTDRVTVETIEGISQGDSLHPLQTAFVNYGAIQCGFCTPGMIMSAKALLDGNQDPSEEDIRKALKHNICRCTGYKKIISAVLAAAASIRTGTPLKLATEIKGIGTPAIRKDAVEKALGNPLYTDDFHVPGALHGELVLSTCAHGEILSIDTGAAKQMEGVAAVLTADDIPGTNLIGIITKKQPVLAGKKVRYIGDAVALVLAETPEQARAAADAVKVAYHELPVIIDMIEARDRKDVSIHDSGNMLSDLHIKRGDVNKGFAQADVIVEKTIKLPAIEHAYLEPDAVYSVPGEDGTIIVYTQSQSSFSHREEIAANLGLPEEKVRVITRTTGGAFGGREEPTIQVHAALGTLVTGRPVRMIMSRYDVLLRTSKRHAEILNYRLGATFDGMITAFMADIIADTGAYPSAGEAVILRSVLFAPGPYEIPNADIYGCAVYTNTTPAGAMRGFGSNQPAIASEVLMDMLAEKLEMDPIDLRIKNGLTEGKQTVGGQYLTESVGLIPTLEKVREHVKENTPVLSDGRLLGIGIASAMKNVGLGSHMDDSAGAIAELHGDTLRLRIASVDSGQGSDTVARQVAAEFLQMNPYDIELIVNDTAQTLDAGVTTASRQTVVTGNAVLKAANLLKSKLLDSVSKECGIPAEYLDCRDRAVIETDGQKKVMSFAEICDKAGALSSRSSFTAPETVFVSKRTDNKELEDEPFRLHFTYCYGTQVAFIALDPETGKVEVLKVLAAHDAGQVINLHGAEGQIEGGIMMGLGYALTEEFRMDEKGLITDTFKKIGVPTIDMMPEMKTYLINNGYSQGPFKAKGMGEIPMLPTTPAILNAIYDASGVRIINLPAKPEKILKALAEKQDVEGTEVCK